MKAVDSSWIPTKSQIALAKSDGIEAWGGYLASGPNEDLLNPWPDSAFQLVRSGGLIPYAYVSGLDDPTWLKAQAASLGIKIILDCENGVRADGTWTDPFLLASGAGLYGDATVQWAHRTHGHVSYIFAGYPGGVQTANWPSYAAQPDPARPLGWQYLGTVSRPYGVVDLLNLDPAVLVDPAPLPPEEIDMQSFDLAPGELRFIGGPDEKTNWNAVALAGDTTVRVFCYALNGKVLGATGVLTLNGNQPGVSGPNQQYGTAAQLGATGPCTLGFEAGPTGSVTVSLHGL